ncbi:MAG: PD-(D/E)XK nuclease family protein [Bryobacteraceae bacterium]
MPPVILTADSSARLHAAAQPFLDSGPLLLLAPTRNAAADFLRAHPGRGTLGVHALTLPQLAAQLATESLGRRGLAPMSPLGQEAIMARVVHRLRAERRLTYFDPVAETPGFVGAAARTVSELRLEDVPRPAAADGPTGDLGRLMAGYADQLVKESLADLAAIYRMAIDTVSHPLLGIPVLLLDVPLRFALQRQLVAAVAARAPRVLSVALDSDIESVAALGAALGVKSTGADAPGAASTLERVRSNLFSTGQLATGAADGTLDIFSAAGEGLECVEIARRIHAVAARGVPFDEIGILLRAPERYQPLLEDALRRAGIPAYFERGTARPDPAGRAFLALLNCAAENCSASRFAEYLSLAQVPALDSRGAPVRTERAMAATQDEVLLAFVSEPAVAEQQEEAGATIAAPFRWERFLVDAAVIGGRDRWERRLHGLEREWELQLRELEDEDSERKETAEAKLAQLRVLQAFALPLVTLLDELPRSANWREWIDKLTELAETALRKPDSVLAVLNELRPMADVGPVELDEVFGVLRDRLRFLRNDPPARRYGQVLIASIDEARGRSFRVAFLPGLAEGIFPRRPFEDPLLLDDYRSAWSPELTVRDRRVERERLLLRIAASAAEELVASYPRMDVVQGRPRVPSFYALEIARAAEGALPDLKEFQSKADHAAPSRLHRPAPEDPADAIDDAEYDVAALDAVSKLARGAARGAARYLMEVSPSLARSLRSRWRRWHSAWSPADGLVEPDPATKIVLDDFRLANRPYSATSLQRYSVCPYQFALHAIYRFQPREEKEPLDQLDPLTRGSIFHSMQDELIGELKQASLVPLDKSKLDRALDIADQIVARVTEAYAEELAPAIPRVWISEIEDLRTDLRGWIRQVAVQDDEWEPVFSEFRFGAEERMIVLDRVVVRGAIDLVERHVSKRILRITDHKTGKPPDPKPGFVGGGKFLQPLLYALVAERALHQPAEAGRLSYCTHRGGYDQVVIPASENARARLAQVLDRIDKAIESGDLPAAPEKDACEYCDFSVVCGPYEELRLRRKSKGRIEPLVELRRLP